jgi:YD repeat-containing protein
VGNKVGEIDAEGKETTYAYDERNKLIQKTDALGNVTLFDYNEDGKLIRQTDAEGKIIERFWGQIFILDNSREKRGTSIKL